MSVAKQSAAGRTVPGVAERAILFDRVSTLGQKGNQSGGEDGYQLNYCQKHATAKGYAVVGTISAVDSGAKYEIDGVVEAIERAERREYEVLVVNDTGRFARDLSYRLVYEERLKKHGVRVEYLNVPDGIDPLMQRALSLILGVFDELERAMIRKRLANGIGNKIRNGEVVGSGPEAYGYQYTTRWSEQKKRDVPYGLAWDGDEKPIVERMFAQIVHQSSEDIARELTTDRIVTPTGRQSCWSGSTVRAILKNTVYRGDWTYDGESVRVPPIVDDLTWHRAQSKLVERRQIRRGRLAADGAADPYELRGRLRCAHCLGQLMTWKNTTWAPASERKDGGQRPRERVYLCKLHLPNRAKQVGKVPCPLPMLLASAAERGRLGADLVGLEEQAWTVVSGVVLNEARLTEKLDRIDETYREAQTRRADDVAVLDRAIASEEIKLTNAIREKARLQPGTPRYEGWDQVEVLADAMLSKHQAARAELLARPAPGVSAERRAELLRVTRQLAAGFANVGPAERRRVYELIDLKGIVEQDREHGVRIGGRSKVTIRWESLLLLDSEQYPSRLCALSSASGTSITLLDHGAAW